MFNNNNNNNTSTTDNTATVSEAESVPVSSSSVPSPSPSPSPSSVPEQVAPNKYKNIINIYSTNSDELNYHTIDQLLENEKQHNKTEPWNKLDKTIKIQKLHQFAEKYGKEHTLPIKDIKSLKLFFVDCLEKTKLQKTKDVVYDKEKREIISIPALHFNQLNRNFTLKIVDAKRVSTLKSLTPKRITEKNLSVESQL